MLNTENLLPDGKYTMLNASIRLTYGGATRSQLLRARLFAERAGRPVDLATFDVYPEYETERRLLAAKGLIGPGVTLRNLYEELAATEDLSQYTDEKQCEIPDWFWGLADQKYTLEFKNDGTPWRRKVDVGGDNRSFFFQYLRQDGSAYATVDRRLGGSDWDRRDRGVVLTDHGGKPKAFYRSIPKLISRWIRIMGHNERQHFLIFDSKESGRLIAEETCETNQFFILTAHTPHLQPPRNWNSLPATQDWGETISGLHNWDAFIVLSDAHRKDLELAEGVRNNVFVLPHPVVLESRETAHRRDPNLAIIVCRLEHQKRIQDALRAFQLVLQNTPDARLEIYGEGSKRVEWEALCHTLSIADSVVFKGYDPNPGAQYDRASVFLMTSLFEAQPLALLEAIAHGCPIVSYDIKYGPAQMVDPGVNGFLTTEGDIKGLASRISDILGDEQMSLRMSAASYEVAKQFDLPTFFGKWTSILNSIVRNKRERVTFRGWELKPTALSLVSENSPVLGICERAVTISATQGTVELTGLLKLETDATEDGCPTGLDIRIRLQQLGTPNVTFLDTKFYPVEDLVDAYKIHAKFDLGKIFVKSDLSSGKLQVFYEVTWNNSHILELCPPKLAEV